MATYASPTERPMQRFADGFGRFAVVVAVLGLLVAVALSVPRSVFDFARDGDGGSAATYAELAPSVPVRLSAAGAGGVELVAPLLETDVEPRELLLDPPDDAPLVTWWKDGARPGATKGQTILIGHANMAGGGLTPIGDLAKGDFVDLLTKRGTMRYEVESRRTYSVKTLDRASLTLFKQDGGAGRLVMLSAQDWDGSRYTRTVVVTGKPLGQPEQD